MQKRCDLPLMARHQPGVGRLVVIRATIFHSISFTETFYLTMAKHGQAGQGRQQSAYSEVFISFAKLIDRRALVGIVHEIYVALQYLRIELQGLLYHATVVGILLVTQHVHERAVIDTMHPQRPYEIS